MPAISEEEEVPLSIEVLQEFDAETEARLLGEPPYEAGPDVAKAVETLQVHSEATAEARSEVAGRQARHGKQLRRNSSDRPEPLGREGTLEVTDLNPPMPPPPPGIVAIEGGQSATAPRDWDADPVSSAELFKHFCDPAVRSGVRRVESAYAGLNIAPPDFWRTNAAEKMTSGRVQREGRRRRARALIYKK